MSDITETDSICNSGQTEVRFWNSRNFRTVESILLIIVCILPMIIDYQIGVLLFSGVATYLLIRFALIDSDYHTYGVTRNNSIEGFKQTNIRIIALVLVIRPIFIVIEDIFGLVQEYTADILMNTLESIFLIVILGPALEEFLYRGIILERMNWYLPDFSSIILSSLIFTVAHWAQGDIMIFIGVSLFRFIQTCFYGAIYVKRRNILHSFVAHSLDNLWAPILILLFP